MHRRVAVGRGRVFIHHEIVMRRVDLGLRVAGSRLMPREGERKGFETRRGRVAKTRFSLTDLGALSARPYLLDARMHDA